LREFRIPARLENVMDGCSVRRTERGFTLVELLVAVTLLSVGVAATIAVFGSASRASLTAQRGDVATQKAEAEIEEIAALKYGEIAMTAAPPSSTDPADPNSRVSGGRYMGEDLVLTPGSGFSAKVDPGPETFVVGVGGSSITGKIYRFVSWRDEGSCADTSNSICTSNHDTKHVVVAVTIDPSPTLPARGPVWASSVISDPNAIPPGSSAAPPATPTVTAQSFYLFDTPCSELSRATPTASHPTHDTASLGTTADDDSTCENGASKQPDLMGPRLPTEPNDSVPPLYDYSSDLSGDRPGGLAMIHQGTSCATSYPAGGGTGALTKWNLHAWSTNPFDSTFHLSGEVTLSLYAATIGGASGRGSVCASLVDRQVDDQQIPHDQLLGSFVYTTSSWPSTPRRVTFTFNLSAAQDVAAGHDLVLVLQARGDSDNDLVLLYDHPLYPSLLEVATSTPLTS
jgi:prepilin-type N-terminal cleavage/methylation domain-containing protein